MATTVSLVALSLAAFIILLTQGDANVVSTRPAGNVNLDIGETLSTLPASTVHSDLNPQQVQHQNLTSTNSNLSNDESANISDSIRNDENVDPEFGIEWIPQDKGMDTESSAEARQQDPSASSPPRFTLSDAIDDPRTSPKAHFIKWLADGKSLLLKDDEGNFLIADTEKLLDGQPLSTVQKVYLSESNLSSLNVSSKTRDSLELSADKRYCMLTLRSEQEFRHSSASQYVIVDPNNLASKYHPVKPPGANNESLNQLFVWNPAIGSEDFVFVNEGNIYYQSNPGAKAERITNGGGDYRLYGISDWLYEEEILGDSKALWWSPSGSYLAYASFDDSNVTKVQLPIYGKAGQPLDFGMNPKRFKEVAYPISGTPNQPGVFLFIWNKGLKARPQLILPPEELFESGPNGFYYLFAVNWISLPKTSADTGSGDGHEYLVVIWANRLQNRVIITLCQPEQNLPCITLLQLNFKEIAKNMSLWAEPKDFQVGISSRTGFFLILPRINPTDGNIYNSVAHIELSNFIQDSNEDRSSSSKQQDDIASALPLPIKYHGGNYDVLEIAGYDIDRDELFFVSAGPAESAGQRHLFRVPTASSANNIVPQCITCLDGPNCLYSTTTFSPNGKRFLVFCSQLFRSSVVHLRPTENITKDVILSENSLVNAHPRSSKRRSKKKPTSTKNSPKKAVFNPPTVKIETVKLSSGIDANVRLLLPPGYDEKNTSSKYPVLVSVYGGPNSFSVRWATPSAWMSYFSSNHQWVIAEIDGRGSANRGWKVKAPIYGRLGEPEIHDQIEAIRLLLEHHESFDAERVAFFGWSYGGFASLHIGALDAGRQNRSLCCCSCTRY